VGLCLSGLHGRTWPSRVTGKRISELIANPSSPRRTAPRRRSLARGRTQKCDLPRERGPPRSTVFFWSRVTG
jgi:hypothetical protein